MKCQRNLVTRALFGVFLICALFDVRIAAQQNNAAQQESAPQQNTAPELTATPTTTASATTTVASDGRVALTSTALALDPNGATLFAGVLRAVPAAGSSEAPIKNVRFVVENRAVNSFAYLSGRVTFYDAAGVRCGEGLFALNSLAASESAEVDAPGLRITCAAAAWRIVPVAVVGGAAVTTNLAPAGSATAGSATAGSATASATASPASASSSVVTEQRLTIEINNTVLPLQLGNPVEVEIGGERVRVVVRAERP